MNEDGGPAVGRGMTDTASGSDALNTGRGRAVNTDAGKEAGKEGGESGRERSDEVIVVTDESF